MTRRLRIATFNLENLDEGPKAEVPLADRLAILRPQLARMEADILCLQEVNGQRPEKGAPRRFLALEALIEGTPYDGYECIGTERNGEGAFDVHNLVVLSRLPVAAARQVQHEHVTAPEHRFLTAAPPAEKHAPVVWERPLQHLEIDIGVGRPLHLLNLHLRSPLAAFVPGQKEGPFTWRSTAAWAEGFYLAAMKRAGQALEARLLVDALFDADPGALVAIAGDCNAELRETALRLLCADEEDTGNGALAARALVPVERGIAEDRRYTVIHAGRKVMLDHILLSHGLMGWYRHVEIHNEGLGDELVAFANVHHSPESYHAPVVAEFALPD